MKIFLFSDEAPTPDDADFIEAMLGMLNSLSSLEAPTMRPRPSQKINKLYSDDVLKLARELDLSVESTIEVMKFKRR